MSAVEEPLVGAIAAAPGPVLLLVHPDVVPPARLPEGTEVLVLPGKRPPGRFRSAFLLVPDRDGLQRCVAALAGQPKVRTVGLWLEYAATPVLLQPRPQWPHLVDLRARRAGASALTVASFAGGVAAVAVLVEMARAAVGPMRHGGLRTALVPEAEPLPGDVRPILLDAPGDAVAEDLVVPPDVVLVPAGLGADAVRTEHPVLTRSPVLAGGDPRVGPVDERLFNPVGFVREETSGRAVLGDGLRLPDGTTHSLRRGATEEMVAALRGVRDVELRWPTAPDRDLATTVAGLAMAGVPLVGAPPAWTRGLLADRLVETLAAAVDTDDDLDREEHSVLLRRAAHAGHSVRAWRRDLATREGLVFREPTVTVVLATRRPELLEFSLAQVRKQRGVALEVVVAAHGHAPDPHTVADLVGPGVTPVVRVHPADALFGDVLRDATDAASGDLVLKMDDDDWYGPDFVTDLLLARSYSGADMVGVASEFVYLEPLDRTVRRTDRTEWPIRFVAGGTILLARALLDELGGFRRVRRWVDASLVDDLHRAGLRSYRSHGLGYCFRRRGSDQHTWQVGLDYFLSDERLARQWDGFAPSRLLEYDASEAPSPAAQ